MSTYKHNYRAFGDEVLRAAWMEALTLEHAERIKAVAEATAPDATPFGVGFKYSFEASSGRRGGLKHDRAYGRVENTDPDAFYIEYGTSDTPAHMTLSRAAAAGG